MRFSPDSINCESSPGLHNSSVAPADEGTRRRSEGRTHHQNVCDPVTYRDLGFLSQAINSTKQSLTSLAPDRKRKFRSRGVQQ